MIGLQRGTVRVVPHDSGWQERFNQEAATLHDALGALALDIQHVGSTAVPGLPAKPIIDIAMAIEDRSAIDRSRAPLAALGYIDRGDSGADGGYLFVKESAPEVRTYHLHVVTCDDPQWRTWLAFRDRLRAEPALRARYAALKNDLMGQYPADRAAYTSGKHDFIHAAAQHSR